MASKSAGNGLLAWTRSPVIGWASSVSLLCDPSGYENGIDSAVTVASAIAAGSVTRYTVYELRFS